MGTTTELETSIQETFTSPRKYAANGTHQRHMTWMEDGMLSLWGNGFWPERRSIGNWKVEHEVAKTVLANANYRKDIIHIITEDRSESITARTSRNDQRGILQHSIIIHIRRPPSSVSR